MPELVSLTYEDESHVSRKVKVGARWVILPPLITGQNVWHGASPRQAKAAK